VGRGGRGAQAWPAGAGAPAKHANFVHVASPSAALVVGRI